MKSSESSLAAHHGLSTDGQCRMSNLSAFSDVESGTKSRATAEDQRTIRS